MNEQLQRDLIQANADAFNARELCVVELPNGVMATNDDGELLVLGPDEPSPVTGTFQPLRITTP